MWFLLCTIHGRAFAIENHIEASARSLWSLGKDLVAAPAWRFHWQVEPQAKGAQAAAEGLPGVATALSSPFPARACKPQTFNFRL